MKTDDKSLRHEMPDVVVIMPYHIKDALPPMADYYDGKANRRIRREQERKNKKK